MIVRIEAQFEEVERDGWLCAQLTGIYTVTRADSSRRDVSRDQLIALLRAEPVVVSVGWDKCPKCGERGVSIQSSDENNYLCTSESRCGPYHADVPDDPFEG